jgi:hypothetical protein
LGISWGKVGFQERFYAKKIKSMLSQKLLEELREIVREDLGKELDDKDLFEFGENLLSYFELLAKIYVRNHLGDGQKLKDRVEFDPLSKRS